MKKGANMNREIKFRAFCGNKMMYPNGIFINGDKIRLMFYGAHEKDECLEYTSIPYNFKEPLFLMQFTGLKDKNGKEIYEGDIGKRGHKKIMRFYGGENEPEIVTETEDIEIVFEIRISPRMGVYGVGKHGTVHSLGKACEIIGNIYENPELLEPKP